MTVMPMDRRWAGEFAAALDRGDHPDEPALAPLLNVVDSLRPLTGAGPGPTGEFRDQLRARLMAAAAAGPVATPVGARHAASRRFYAGTRPSPVAAGFGSWQRRIVAACAGAGIAVAGMGTVAVASTSALPGDTLYGVKRTVEDVRLSLARGDAARGAQYLSLAGTRLSEAERVVTSAGGQPVNDATVRKLRATFGDMAAATRKGSTLLTGEYRRTGEEKALRPLQRFTGSQRQRIQDIQPRLPDRLQVQSAGLLAQLAQIDDQVSRLTAPGDADLGGGAEPSAPGSSGGGTTRAEPGTAAPSPSGARTRPGAGVPALPQPAVPSTPSSSPPPVPDPGVGTGARDGGLLPLPVPVPTGSPLSSQLSTPLSRRSTQATLPPLVPGLDPSAGIGMPPLLSGLAGLGLDLGGLGGGLGEDGGADTGDVESDPDP